jgi:asparagine synthase (glutamine-hydrolysing)
LLAGRDRFGEKPFFYSHTASGEFVFASEIKALLASGLITSDISRASLARFLSHGYTGPKATIYDSIKSLPPAHFLVLEEGTIKVERYWNLPATSRIHENISDAAEEFSALFDQAVRRQMVADVEVSAFLSGGLDSSSVVSVASRINPKIKTLAFGYAGEESELPYAREAAELYGTDHHEMFEQQVDVENLYVFVSSIFDEPFSDSSAMATYLICKQASQFGKVVLTGDGGDELLGGYSWWYYPIVEALAAKDHSALRHAFVRIMAVQEKIGEWIGFNRRTDRKWRHQFLAARAGRTNRTPLEMVQDRFPVLSCNELSLLQIKHEEPFESAWLQDDSLNDAMKFDIVDYMPGDILVKTDRCAMRNSLELRAPFLDIDFASFCIAQPANYKVSSKGDKLLLREALGANWPASVRTRSKQGFGLKSDRWFNTEKMQKIKQELLYSRQSKLYQLLPYEGVMELLRQNPGRQNSILSLAIWINGR